MLLFAGFCSLIPEMALYRLARRIGRLAPLQGARVWLAHAGAADPQTH